MFQSERAAFRLGRLRCRGFGPAAEVLLFRQKDPKPLTPRLASLKRRDANPEKSGPTRRAQTRSARRIRASLREPAGRRRINIKVYRGKPTEGGPTRGVYPEPTPKGSNTARLFSGAGCTGSAMPPGQESLEGKSESTRRAQTRSAR